MIEVEDTGTGMTPEVQAHIFEPYFTTKGLLDGNGLGLATVQAIVNQARGEIAVASTVGRGKPPHGAVAGSLSSVQPRPKEQYLQVEPV